MMKSIKLFVGRLILIGTIFGTFALIYYVGILSLITFFAGMFLTAFFMFWWFYTKNPFVTGLFQYAMEDDNDTKSNKRKK